MSSHYRVLEQLGAGSMGVVHRAVQEPLGREVALKFLSPEIAGDPLRLERFRREMQVCTRLSHPNIIRVFDAGELDGRPFYAMELVHGATPLDEVIAGAAPLPADHAALVTAQLLEALDCCHAAGLVHRDVKPSNILILPGGRVILMDFGVVKDLDATNLTRSGATLGSPLYMAPEVWLGDPITPAIDLWAAGVVLHEMLAATRPFTGRTVADIAATIVHTPAPPLPDAPPPVAEVLQSLLAKDPTQRPDRAAHPATRLRTFLEGPVDLDVSLHRSSHGRGSRSRPRRAPAAAEAPAHASTRASTPGGGSSAREWMNRGAGRAVAGVVLGGLLVGGIEFGVRRRLAGPVAGVVTEAGRGDATSAGAGGAVPEEDGVSRAARLKARLEVVRAEHLAREMGAELRVALQEKATPARLVALAERWSARVGEVVSRSRLEEALTAVVDAGGLDAVYRDARVSGEVKRALYAQRCAWGELEALGQAAGVKVPAIAKRMTSSVYGQLGGALPARLEGRAAIIGEEPILGAQPPAGLAVTSIGGVRRRMRAHADSRGAFDMELIPGLRPFHVVPGLLKGRGAFEIRAGVGDATRARGLRVLASADPQARRDRWTLLAEMQCSEHDYAVVHHTVPADVVPDGAVYLRVEPLYNVVQALVLSGIVQDLAVVWIAVSP